MKQLVSDAQLEHEIEGEIERAQEAAIRRQGGDEEKKKSPEAAACNL